MTVSYNADLRRFGGPNPQVDETGKRTNLRHIDDIEPGDVVTDGCGNILSMPLLRKKPCFGRPERLLRGLFGKKIWTDENGVKHPGDSPCYSCELRTPKTFEACHIVIDERVASCSNVDEICHRWFDETGSKFGPACFNGKNGKIWDEFLGAIESHGGWTNINEMQVKLDAIAAGEKERRKRALDAKIRRQVERKRKQGLIGPVSPIFLEAVDEERERRGRELKTLRHMQGRSPSDMLWINSTPDSTWERVADVWRAKDTALQGDSLDE